MIEVEEDDDDFLFQVARAEANALSNKRRRINSIDTNTDQNNNNKKKKHEEEQVAEDAIEGIYVAALRGSNSLRWQQLNNSTRSKIKPLDPLPNYFNNQSLSSSVDFDAIPEKKCPCGLGSCLVLTANTERNQGRKFFKCPVRLENGGCGFFEWCDTGSSGNRNNASDLLCPCGAGFCFILTAKTGKNIGQQFYRCPANQGTSCGFFKWCNENFIAAVGRPANVPKVSNSMNDLSNKSYSGRAGSSCFKCGNEGHWTKNCPNSLSDSRFAADSGVSTASSSTCYKCGKPGHWARNCTSSQHMNGYMSNGL